MALSITGTAFGMLPRNGRCPWYFSRFLNFSISPLFTRLLPDSFSHAAPRLFLSQDARRVFSEALGSVLDESKLCNVF
jgi:hypothetical protein